MTAKPEAPKGCPFCDKKPEEANGCYQCSNSRCLIGKNGLWFSSNEWNRRAPAAGLTLTEDEITALEDVCRAERTSSRRFSDYEDANFWSRLIDKLAAMRDAGEGKEG